MGPRVEAGGSAGAELISAGNVLDDDGDGVLVSGVLDDDGVGVLGVGAGVTITGGVGVTITGGLAGGVADVDDCDWHPHGQWHRPGITDTDTELQPQSGMTGAPCVVAAVAAVAAVADGAAIAIAVPATVAARKETEIAIAAECPTAAPAL
jgi:hypothetical protein